MSEQNPRPDHLGKYELTGLLQEGGAGQMWRARDTQSGRSVLLKVVAASVSRSSAFGRYFYDKWADQQSLLEHPNILRVLEVGTEADRHYVALEDPGGESLSEKLEQAPLDADEALGAVRQIAEGLRAAHRRDVMHGHLKPSDIIVTSDQRGRPLLKVAFFDMGVSAEQSIVSLPGGVLGTPKYMAPEVIQGRPPSPQADIFALGVLAYELFTGKEPFPADHVVGYLFANCRHEPVPADQANERVPREVALVIGRMLEKDPRRRYGSMQRTIDDLDRSVTTIKTGRVEVVPYGTDSAFARQYQLPEAERKRPAGALGSAARVIALVVIAAAVGLLGYSVGRVRFRPAEEPGAATEPAQQPREPALAELPTRPPASPAAPTARGEAGRETEAARAFRKAMADWEIYPGREDYDFGVTLFVDMAQRYPDTPFATKSREQAARIYTQWAHSLARTGGHQEAVAKYERAIELAPEGSEFARLARRNMPSAMVRVAEALEGRGEYARALELYEQVARDYPGTKEAGLLVNRKPAVLLNQAFVAWQDEKEFDEAVSAMMEIIKQYPGTEAALRARRAMPSLYLDAVRDKLDKGDLQEARQQLVQLVEAYPEHEAAARAAELDAETLFRLFVAGDAAGEVAVGASHYGELLRRYPSSGWAVKAARINLSLPRGAGDTLYDDKTARNQLQQAEKHYDAFDFVHAIGTLRGVIQFARADSPLASEALAKLPSWLYESAIHAYGTGAAAECEERLEELCSQFPHTGWDDRSRTTLDRIKSPPEGMVFVPEGRFRMGSEMSEIEAILRDAGVLVLGGSDEEIKQAADIYGILNETPQHAVSTRAFYIDKTEVTNEQYKQYVEETRNPPPAHWRGGTYPEGEADLPVVNVSLAEAHAYAQWREARLPTESEWEKAARGVDGRTFPWGEVFGRQRCHHMRTEDAGPVRVASYPTWQSPYGCLDMIGNVLEWTDSVFIPYPGGEAEYTVGEGPPYGGYQVARGGAWYQHEIAPIPARCASRYPMDAAAPNMATGFRCVRDIQEARTLPTLATAGTKP